MVLIIISNLLKIILGIQHQVEPKKYSPFDGHNYFNKYCHVLK